MFHCCEEVKMKVGMKVIAAGAAMLLLAVGANRSQGESIYIPNASFELPPVTFVSYGVIDSWQKTPKPVWYDESSGYYWNQLTGVFLNVAPSDPEYINNCDANQAAWLFAVPEVGLYQDLAATFEVGQCYQLTVGVIGGAGNMKDGVPLELRLYCRDANDTPMIVGAATFTYHRSMGPLNHFRDVQVSVPAVQETDPWAGKKIGVEIISTLTLADLDPATGKAGGYWDIDNFRLVQTPPVTLVTVDVPNASFELPQTNFVDPNIASWQKGAKPVWYDESGGAYWSQMTGAFLNVAPPDPAHISNCDANQAAWLFAVPEVQLYQDLSATFGVGQSYQFTVGVIGGAGNMKDGVPLELRLYYRDANDVPVIVGAATFTYHPAGAQFNRFRDVQLSIPAVQRTGPWATKKIGVQIISGLTLGDPKAGGYWDIDNVRLTCTPPEDLVQETQAALGDQGR
jgi:hypothetical protein